MIPSVFVSSTIADLAYLREAVRETVLNLGYKPILSEFGDIGYLPHASAIDSAYLGIREANLAIFIVGKRYGHIDKNTLSVTENEFERSSTANIPMIFLVDREVWAFKKVFDANEGKKLDQEFPGMDSPQKTFRFLHKIANSPTNNGVLLFDRESEARDNLKKQIAHIFGDLLQQRFGNVNAQLNDVLAEIKTLRHELTKGKEVPTAKYLRLISVLLGDQRISTYKSLIQNLSSDVANAVPVILESDTFRQVVERLDYKIFVQPVDFNKPTGSRSFAVMFLTDNEETGVFEVTQDKRLFVDKIAIEGLERTHQLLRETSAVKY